MNTIDIIISVLLAYALIKGWFSGFLVQIAGIVGIIVAFWSANYCTTYIDKLLGMENASHQVVYIVTLIIIMILVILLLKLLDKILKSAGLSLFIRITGVLFSVGKWVLLLALLLSVYLSTVKILRLDVSKEVRESIYFKPLKYIDDKVFPYISNAKNSIPDFNPNLSTETKKEQGAEQLPGAII